jgi:hypothetical protein
MHDMTSLLMPTGLAALFGLAMLSVRFALVYRRNNLASGFALCLFITGLYLWGWLGFAAFTMGTLFCGWQWVASISRANERQNHARLATPGSMLRRSA